jgi:hypothetical protein
MCCDIDAVYIPDNIKKVGHSAFSHNERLAEAHIPESWDEIPYSLFSGCESLGTFNIPPNLVTIGMGAFLRCPIKSLVLPATLRVIGKGAFEGCGALEEVIIPSPQMVTLELTSYGSGKKEVSCFSRIAPNAILRVPKNLVEEYKAFFNGKGAASRFSRVLAIE